MVQSAAIKIFYLFICIQTSLVRKSLDSNITFFADSCLYFCTITLLITTLASVFLKLIDFQNLLEISFLKLKQD